MTREELGITEAGARHIRTLTAYYEALNKSQRNLRWGLGRPVDPMELARLKAEMDEADQARDEEYWEDRRRRGLDCSMRPGR